MRFRGRGATGIKKHMNLFYENINLIKAEAYSTLKDYICNFPLGLLPVKKKETYHLKIFIET